MLPGLGFSEILLVAVIALIVVGPKDLPLMMRRFARFMGQVRALANEFRAGFDELARQAELDELKREVEALRRGASKEVEAFYQEVTQGEPEQPAPLPSPASPPPAPEQPPPAPSPVEPPAPPLEQPPVTPEPAPLAPEPPRAAAMG